jgi:transcriptional regulator with XRE-family HTH domain
VNYGKALKIARAIAGLQQNELARLAHVNPSLVSLIENGQRQPSLKTVEKFTKALRIPNHLFTLLAAERDDLKGASPDQLQDVAQMLARLILDDPAQARRRIRPNRNLPGS